MAWTYTALTQAEQDQLWADRLKAVEHMRFDSNENRKAVRVRLGITTEQRQQMIAREQTIMVECAYHKAGLYADRGLVFDPLGSWSYTGNITVNGTQYRIFPGQDRTARKDTFIKDLEKRYRNFELDRIRIVQSQDPAMNAVVSPGKTRRQQLLDSLDLQLRSLELEKNERITDTSTNPAPR